MGDVEEIKLQYPLPIAKLYEAMDLETEPRLRVRKLVDLFEGTLSYLALVGLAEYVRRGLCLPYVEYARAEMELPSLGNWAALAKGTATALKYADPPLSVLNIGETYKEDPILEATVTLNRVVGTPTNRQTTKLELFLDIVTEFRNRKLGHGILTTLEAREVCKPLEAALVQWLGTTAVLVQRRLAHVARVEWQDPHFVLVGTQLNCGTRFEPLSLERDQPLTPNRVYLHDSASDDFLPLHPFFLWDADWRVLYLYAGLSTARQFSLRCPYEAPGVDTMRHLAADPVLIMGSGLSRLKSEPSGPPTSPGEGQPQKPQAIPGMAESLEQYLIKEHPTDTNLYLTHFLKMYSQSRTSNQGTRGYDPLTYTAIKLDEALAPAIASGEHALVVISGNAGDGKTAFIQRLESELRDQGAEFAAETSNGSRFTWQGREYQTVYDGSQDEGATGSDEVLDGFFAPFKDGAPATAHQKMVRVIAINEGRLLHFLSNRQQVYGHLYAEVRDQLAGVAPTKTEVLVVNLNRRSVVDGRILDYNHPEGWSIFDRLLDRLLDHTYWAPCEACSYRERCPVKFNVDTLMDPAMGTVVRQRLKFLFQITHFRHRVHITIRELRSALAYILFGIRECCDIQAHLEQPEETLPFVYYNSVFARCEQDRLLKRLAELDVVEVANPQLDNQLNFVAPDEVAGMLRAEHRAPADLPLLTTLFAQRPRFGSDMGPDGHALAAQYHAAVRRRFFFENGAFRQLEQQPGGYKPVQLPELQMVPAQHVWTFARFVAGDLPASDLLGDLVRGLNHGEGMYRQPYDQTHLCLRTSERWGQVKAFGLFPKGDFQVQPAGGGDELRYLEFIPDAIRLLYNPGDQHIEISLDLYEAILRMRDGYQPSTAELKSFFQNLQMFKKQVLGSGSGRIALLPTEGTAVNIVRIDARSVAVEPV